MPPSSQDPLGTINSTGPQISNVQNQLSRLRDSLASSPTAASSNAAPTAADVNNESQATTLQSQLVALQKQNRTAAWYGADTGSATSGDQGGSPGVIGSAINFLQRPLHGVVQGVKDVIGDKTQVPNQDFTDLLAQHGVGGFTGSALGLTADVLFDPVNWVTAGTGALLPRVGYGLYKGAAEAGLSGAAKAAGEGALSSSFGHGAAFLASHIPFTAGEESSLSKAVSAKILQASDNYKALTGADPMKYITSPGIGRGLDTSKLGGFAPDSGAGVTIGDLTKQVFHYIPNGDNIFKSLYYDPRDWLEKTMMEDAGRKLVSSSVEEMDAAGPPSAAAIAARESESLSSLKPNMELLKNVPAGKERDAIIDALQKASDEMSFIGKNPDLVMSVNPEQNTYRVIQESADLDSLRQILAPLVDEYGQSGPSGIKWWDDAVKWGNGVKVKIGPNEITPIKTFIDTYNSIIQGAFKPAHTILSPVTWAMNVMSAPVMHMMSGGNAESLFGFMNDYRKAYLGYAGIDPRSNVVRAFLGPATKAGEEWKTAKAANVRDFMEKYPETTRRSLTKPGFFIGHYAIQDMVDKSVASGLYTEAQATSGEAERELLAAHQELTDQIRAGNLTGKPKQSVVGRIAGFLGKKVYSPAETQSDTMKALGEAASESPGDRGALGGKVFETGSQPGTVAGFTIRDPEISTDLLDRVDSFIKSKAESGSKPFQAFQNIMDNARAGYEHQDQAFRTATVLDLVERGIPEDRLKILSRFVPMKNPETQIISRGVRNGQRFVRTSMDYALEVAHEEAINYGAMPAAIKMLRSVPLVGSPFASFSYGMGVRTAQTLAYNPAFFNRAAFGAQSLQGHKTPLEKEALKRKYYNWYNSPSMVRLPDAMSKFISQYPLYWNLSNVLPYYSLSIFQPSNRSYSSVLPDNVVKILDAAPVMKDPLGQALFDNFLLPSLLNNAERPMNSMGSPLYPINATAGDKAFYIGRGLVDNLTPSAIAPIGLVLPSDYAKYYPGYRTRQMSEGQFTGSKQYPSANALGIPGTEPVASRTIRNILGYLGFPVEQLNTTYAGAQKDSLP